MSTPYPPYLFPPRPPHSNQYRFPPPPNSWRPPNQPPFPPDMFNPHFHPPPPRPPPPCSSMPPFMGPPNFNISGACNVFPWRPPMSCDAVRPMGFQPRRGAKRGWDHSRGSGGINTRKKMAAVFECKTCSKEYKTEETYKIHVQSHVKCRRCEFEGSGRAMKEHELVHLLPDVLKFSSEQDIKKWREERRKNFPTAENIARKKQLAQDKSQRGESAVTPLHRYIQHLVGEDSRPGSSRRGRRGRGRGCGRGRGRPFNQRGRQQQFLNTKPNMAEEIQNKAEDNRSDSKDDNDTTGDDQPNHDGILEAIIADCAVAESAGIASVEADCNVTLPPGDQATPVIRDGSKEGETSSPRKRARDDTCSSDTGANKKRSKWTSRKQNKRNKKAVTGLRAITAARKPTLLEKLLATEIRREENALLQCIRHVVSNNFFIPQPSNPTTRDHSQPDDTAMSCEDVTTTCDTSPNSCDISPQSCSSPVIPCDNSPRSCDILVSSCEPVQRPSVNAIYEHSHTSPDRPVSSCEPPDRSCDILY